MLAKDIQYGIYGGTVPVIIQSSLNLEKKKNVDSGLVKGTLLAQNLNRLEREFELKITFKNDLRGIKTNFGSPSEEEKASIK